MTSSLIHRAALVSASAVLSLGAAACGGSDSVSVPDGNGGSVSVDQDEDGVTVDTGDGSITSGSKLPDDFPTDKVPLIDGEVVSAVSVDQTGAGGFNVVVESSKSADDAFAEAVDLLTKAGYEKSESFAGAASIAGLEGPEYTILLQVAQPTGDARLSYTVAATGS